MIGGTVCVVKRGREMEAGATGRGGAGRADPGKWETEGLRASDRVPGVTAAAAPVPTSHSRQRRRRRRRLNPPRFSAPFVPASGYEARPKTELRVPTEPARPRCGFPGVDGSRSSVAQSNRKRLRLPAGSAKRRGPGRPRGPTCHRVGQRQGVCGTSPHHFGITRPRRYPIQQGRYSCVLATLCRNGGHRKRVLSRGSSRVVCRPSTVRIAPPGSNLARFPIAAQIPKAPDPWSKEAVLLALERWKRKKRTVEEEEDQISAAGQEDKRRCHDSSGSGHSAFKPEVANGVPAAFVPEPGPLKRGLSSPSSDGELRKRTCTPAVSCSKGTCTCGIRMSRRNAITSSYTSTGGISQLWKRCPSASPFSSPASSLSQTRESPEKKMREEDGPQGSGSSAPPVNKESQGEQATTSDFESTTQTTISGGSTPSSHVTSGVSAGPAGTGDFGMSV
ncbi:nuclear envelope pore membrane protein POM 121-like [Manis pentadactyla]|uniref:nuclear envelope pore membrane protein POM 121-like n=1 Tax=Manis pentadactyla TaxID=143292 RepID=UPI00255C48F9|nr:nuclear envelope pore membrane protein POM 121-like [Manis pentadactyla]XP_057343951.1 nuclear envelope pore membrane protein POM 121-like [Manis pentadactyla]